MLNSGVVCIRQGTLQFMALELLRAAKNGKAVEHTVSHDLESIALVFGYTVMRHTLNIPGCPPSILELFNTIYGAVTVSEIIQKRKSQQPLTWLEDTEDDLDDFMKQTASLSMIQLMYNLGVAIHSVNDAVSRNKLVCSHPP